MGFLDFLKNIFKTEEVEKEIQKVTFSELDEYINNKKIENNEKKQIFLRQITTKIKELIENLSEKSEALKEININDKKAEERVKFIVKENLEKYKHYLKKLIENLKELTEDNLITNLNNIFNDFEKKSHISYEKATFLIGKELGQTRDAIVNFSISLQKIIKENKPLIDESKQIAEIEKKFKELNESNKTETSQKNKVNEIHQKIQDSNDKLRNIHENIEDLKQNKEYQDEKQQEKQIAEKNDLVEIEIFQLKELINFKELANICHSSEKDMETIKKYKSNFQKAYLENKDKIINLLEESKLQSPEMYKKINTISRKHEEIDELKKNMPQEQTKKMLNFESGKRNTELILKELKDSFEKEEKKLAKLSESLDKLKNELKHKVGELGTELES